MGDVPKRLRAFVSAWLGVRANGEHIHHINGLVLTTDDLAEAADHIATLQAKLAVAREALRVADAEIGWDMEDKSVRAGLQKALKEIGND